MTTSERRNESVVSADGTTIAYQRVGRGAPVVVLHGGLGSSQSWRAVAERLADSFEFSLLDRRGRGSSDEGASPHSLAREVEDARAVMSAARGPAAVLGHSYGGAVALELCRSVGPGQVSHLVVYEPAIGVGGLIPAVQLERIEALVDNRHTERALELGIEQLAAAGLVHSDRGGERGPAQVPDALARIAWTVSRELRAVDSLGGGFERYASIDVSTLLMVGTLSPPRQRSNCDALADVLPAVTLAHLTDQGHVAHNTDPEQVAALLRSFLAETPGG